MALTLVTGSAAEPLSIDEAKTHLRIADSSTDDEVWRWIAASRTHCETLTERKFTRETWRLKLDRFPSGPIWLPFPPVTSVTSITYVDTNGVTQTWSASLYTTDLPAGPTAAPARIVPAYQESYPDTRDVINAVTIQFVCGYDDTGTPLPKELWQAMLIVMGHWDTHRSAVVTGTISQEIDQGLAALLWPFKAFTPEMA